ncbi:MAG TPA: glycosyltransferase [Blastocatellia bacterium]
MKILHITPSFYPAFVYGGPIVSVYNLCRNLIGTGCEVRVLTTDANGAGSVLDVDTDRELETDGGLRVRYCHRLLDVSVSPGMLRWLPSYVRWADVVHLMAVYSFPTIPALMVCKAMGKPVVWSPRGMLQRWEGTRRPGLKAIWETACRIVSPSRMVLHVTSDQEAAETSQRMPGARLATIPNGIEIPETRQPPAARDHFRLVYLGRIDPKKGIENLLDAYQMLNGNLGRPSSLTIAGSGDPFYTKAIESRIASSPSPGSIRMIGAVEGQAKTELLTNADVVVVPSHTENFGLVVAEALAQGVPVIASKGTPWSRMEEVGCGLWIDNSPASLASGIERISNMPLGEMGRKGREWVTREFSWPLIAQRMTSLYSEMAAMESAR